MFSKLFKLFSGLGTRSGSSQSEISSFEKFLAVDQEVWAYGYVFTDLPKQFYGNLSSFIDAASRGVNQAVWTHYQLNEGLHAHILVFDPRFVRLTDNKARMAAAIYNQSTNTPLEFYVLIENLNGVRIRQVDSSLASFTVRQGLKPIACEPDLESFINFLKSNIS